MLLSLYELSIESQKDKYELLAAINMIYKKTANESMFKYSEIAQSIIHILEDEYQDIFS
jgi:PIN domain nuclease of toxin-antitoxin system